MAAYLADGIMNRGLDYTAVVTRYPKYKNDIDKILVAEGRQDLIVE